MELSETRSVGTTSSKSVFHEAVDNNTANRQEDIAIDFLDFIVINIKD